MRCDGGRSAPGHSAEAEVWHRAGRSTVRWCCLLQPRSSGRPHAPGGPAARRGPDPWCGACVIAWSVASTRSGSAAGACRSRNGSYMAVGDRRNPTSTWGGRHPWHMASYGCAAASAPGQPAGVQQQATRVLPVMRSAADVADCGAPHRQRRPARTSAAVSDVLGPMSSIAAGAASSGRFIRSRHCHRGAGVGGSIADAGERLQVAESVSSERFQEAALRV